MMPKEAPLIFKYEGEHPITLHTGISDNVPKNQAKNGDGGER